MAVRFSDALIAFYEHQLCKLLLSQPGPFWAKDLPAELKMRSTGAEDAGMERTAFAVLATCGPLQSP